MMRRLMAAWWRLEHSLFGDTLGAALLFAVLIIGTWWADALQVAP